MFSLKQRELLHNIEFDNSARRDMESGFVFATRFSKPTPNFILAGGAGKNEVRIFENNADGSANFRTLAHISELETPCLSMDATKSGDHFAFGCQDGKVYLFGYKLEETGGEFEGYHGGLVKGRKGSNTGAMGEDEEEKKE